MLKDPRPGRVKTRLGRDIGLVPATWWFRHQVSRLLRHVQDPRWSIVLAVAPDRQGMASRSWPSHLPRVPQGQGDLGARMMRAVRAMPPGPVCVIGSDIPDITPKRLEEAFGALGSNDAVFGPADDGGYWLVGFAQRARNTKTALRGVRWSGPHALKDSAQSLGGCRIAHVAQLADVDSLADLKRLSGRN
jgi:rSAM/selenodomain-associated transferase 1